MMERIVYGWRGVVGCEHMSNVTHYIIITRVEIFRCHVIHTHIKMVTMYERHIYVIQFSL